MIATILLYGRCPVCGYRNEGVQVGTLRPGMRQFRLETGSIGWHPPACSECAHPLAYELFDCWALNRETTAKLRAWQERQRGHRQRAKQAAS